MIDVRRYVKLGNLLAGFPPLQSFIYGAADEDLIAKIQVLESDQYPVLVGILPTIMGMGRNMDELGYESPLFFYALDVIRNRTDEELVSTWEKTLDGIKGIQKALKWYRNYPQWRELYDVTPDSIQIDPEYGIWGCMGWSIRFNIVHENEITIEGYEPGY
jgi:hypothetical protein